MKYIFLLAFLPLSINLSAQDSPGNMLDKTFSGNGIYLTQQTSNNIEFGSVVSANDRSFVVGYGAAGGTVVLQGYKEDGSVNTKFGNNGSVVAQYPGYEIIRINQMLKMSDGRIISFFRASTDQCALFCIKENGIPDSSFGVNGWSVAKRYSTDMTLLDGDIIATVSYWYYPSDSVYHNFQFFNKNGKLIKETSVFVGYPWHCNDFNEKTVRIATTADNKVVSAGWASYVGEGASRKGIFLVRLTLPGVPDSTFNNNGIKLVPVAEDFLSCIAVDKTNRIMLAIGSGITCLGAGGDVDKTFGIAGTAPVVFIRASYHSSYIRDIKIQNDNKFIAFGSAWRDNVPDVSNFFALARYKDNGTVDSTFGLYGTTATPFYENGTIANSVPEAMTIQNDNKILCVGFERIGDASHIEHGAMARYLPERSSKLEVVSYK